MTTDARAVIGRIPSHALAADRCEMTLWDLAAALTAASGNTAGLWHAATAEAPPAAEPPAGTVPPPSVIGPVPSLRFDREARVVLEQALLIALHERAEHIGTEHLLAALLRTGPPEVVTWLAARGVAAETVDALLARLHGGPGVERLPAKLSRTDRWRWRRATARLHGGRWTPRTLVMVATVLAVMVVLVLCVWGP